MTESVPALYTTLPLRQSVNTLPLCPLQQTRALIRVEVQTVPGFVDTEKLIHEGWVEGASEKHIVLIGLTNVLATLFQERERERARESVYVCSCLPACVLCAGVLECAGVFPCVCTSVCECVCLCYLMVPIHLNWKGITQRSVRSRCEYDVTDADDVTRCTAENSNKRVTQKP